MAYVNISARVTNAEHSVHRATLARAEQHALNLVMPGVRHKRLGRGWYSSVYQGPTSDSVIRVCTSDGVDSDFLRPCAELYFEGKATAMRPRLIDELEHVNDQIFEYCTEHDLPHVKVMQVEKLEKLKNRSLAYHTNKLLHMLVSNGGYPRVIAGTIPMDEAYMRKWLAHEKLDGLDDFAEGLARFCADYELRVDKVSHDLMVRPSTGELVINDPVMPMPK